MKEELLSLARASIQSAFQKDADLEQSIEASVNRLNEEGAAFVTLTQHGELRGCIGSLVARRSLGEDIFHNARSAAFKDPRFLPLNESELDRTRIEVSVLSQPQELEYTDRLDLRNKIRVGIDGVILKQGIRQATFLPQVWEQLESFELFFSHLCQKAGLSYDCLAEHPQILIYQVEKYREDEVF